MTSHALSAAAAIRGSPAGMPVASAASGVITPICAAGGTNSGRCSGRTASARHFQSRARDQVWRYVEELNRDGVTFFLTTQYLEEADRLCHDIAIMDRGKIVAKGSPAELKSSIGTDAITVLFASDDDAQRADSRIRQLPGIDSTALAGREVVAYLRNGASAVAGIVLALNDAGLTVSELRLAQATLDDVFLRATGHHLEVDKRVEVAAVAGGAA